MTGFGAFYRAEVLIECGIAAYGNFFYFTFTFLDNVLRCNENIGIAIGLESFSYCAANSIARTLASFRLCGFVEVRDFLC